MGNSPCRSPGIGWPARSSTANAANSGQRYREGQEDQLGALGLVLNAVVLWNTRYTAGAPAALRQQGYPVADKDAARLSPLVDEHLNVHGRYTFTEPAGDGLRPLRDPAVAVEQDLARPAAFGATTFGRAEGQPAWALEMSGAARRRCSAW